MTLGFVSNRACSSASRTTTHVSVLAFAGILSASALFGCSSSHAGKRGHSAGNGEAGDSAPEVRGTAQALTYYGDVKPIFDQK